VGTIVGPGIRIIRIIWLGETMTPGPSIFVPKPVCTAYD
jgi:hypothetical protein